MTPPLITVALTEDGEWQLMASSYGQTMPAGDRLIHAVNGKWPRILYVSPTKEQAEVNATLLREHIGSWGKQPSKKEARALGD